MAKRILITGFNGFVGRHLVRRLFSKDEGCEIIGIETHVGSEQLDHRIRSIQCDILSNGGSDIANVILDTAPDRIFHLAGIAMGGATDRARVFDVNVRGAINVFEAAAKLQGAKLLFMSTGYIYGHCTMENPAKETDTIPEPGIYGAYRDSKAEAEKFARQSGAVIIRSFNMTGPGQTESFSVPSFAKQIAEIESETIPPVVRVGNLEAYRDFFDVRDAVVAIAALAESGAPGEAYNVCSGSAHKVRDVLETLVALSRAEIDVQQDPDRMRPSDLPSNVGDPAKTQALTNWRPQFTLRQTLEDTLNWWRQKVTMPR